MKNRYQKNHLLAAITLAGFAFTTSVAFAASLTWDTVSGDGAAITAGTGNWNTTATNWNNAGTNEAWSQTSNQVALHDAVFAGSDGTLNQYVITLSGTVNALSVAFNSSGYQLTGAALILRPTSTTNGSITVAADKTATISSTITYSNNANAAFTVNSGATLNLGGGASNSQYRFAGAGTVNMTAGTYTANVGSMNAATFNQTGGTFNMTLPAGASDRFNIGVNAGRSVSWTLSGGTINANSSNDTNANSLLSIGRNHANTAFTNTLNVQGTGVLNVGTTANRAGELHIANTANSNGTLNVTGGTVTVGTGKTDNKIYLFKAGSDPGYTADLTQSGGTITANGIQFGGDTGSYDGTSAANLTLSGGSLYIGAQGITRGSAANALPVTLKLEGGTLGASQNWSSSMDMKLGTSGGGVTFLAANSGGTARNIALSGILSDDGAVNGSLTKTGSGTLTLSGANSYTGGTVVNAGTLLWSGDNNLPATGTLQVNAGGNFSLADGTARSTSTAALGLASGSLLSFDWNGSSVDTLTSTAAATTEGTVGLVINNISPLGSGGTLISSPAGGLTTANGTRYLLANNTDYTAAITVTDTTVSIGAQTPATALTDAYWLGGQVTGALGSMNLSDGTTSNWATDAAGTPAGGVVPGGSAVNVIFGATGATQQSNVTMFADLNLGSITFNDNEAVTLGGSYFLTLNNTSATAATSSGAGTTVTPGSAITVTTYANAVNTINSNIILGASQTWNIASDKTLAIGGAVSGAAALTKADGGTLTLTGNNTYTGTTTVSSGTLKLSGSGRLSTTGTTNVYASAISLGAGATFEHAGSVSQTLSGAITGGGSLVLNGAGSGLILSGTGNSYGSLTMTSNVVAGRLFINNAGALPAAATVAIDGGTFVINAAGTYDAAITAASGVGITARNAVTLTNVTLPGSGSVIFNNDDASTNLLTISSDQTLTGALTVQVGGNKMTTTTAALGAATLSGKLTGSGPLVVTSDGNSGNLNGLFRSGVLTLEGLNDYAGDTTVNSGTLRINGDQSAATGAVTVGGASAAGTPTLAGIGTIGGNVTIAAAGGGEAGTLAPGSGGIGNLILNGTTLAFGSGATASFEVDADTIANRDQVTGIGALTYGGALKITATGTLEEGDSWDLFDFTSQSGTFDNNSSFGTDGTADANLPDLGSGLVWQFNYATGTLSVAAASGSPYDTWAADKGLTGLPGSSTDPAKTADPDKDGKNNLQEFAFDGNPLSGASDGKVVGKVASVSAAQVLTLTLPVRTGATFADDSGDQLSGLIDGIYYRIEGGTDLVSFAATITEVTTGDEAAIQAGLPALSTGWTYRTFRTAGTVPSVPKDFMRAKISETP